MLPINQNPENRGQPLPDPIEANADVVSVEMLRGHKGRAITDKFAMGDELRKMAATMTDEKGAFTRWLKEKLNMQRTTATNLMRLAAAVPVEDREIVAERFDLAPCTSSRPRGPEKPLESRSIVLALANTSQRQWPNGF